MNPINVNMAAFLKYAGLGTHSASDTATSMILGIDPVLNVSQAAIAQTIEIRANIGSIKRQYSDCQKKKTENIAGNMRKSRNLTATFLFSSSIDAAGIMKDIPFCHLKPSKIPSSLKGYFIRF